MKNTLVLILAIGLVLCVIPQDTFAQDTQDLHLRYLSKGVKARIGKGALTGKIASSDDGKRLAAAGSIGIWIYNVETGKILNLLTGHTGWVTNVAFSPDGKTLASTSEDHTVRLWNPQTGAELQTMQGHKKYSTSVAFSPDGKTLASGSTDETIRFWDVATGTNLRVLAAHERGVQSVAFSPDGKTLVSTSWDGIVLLWNLAVDNVD